jgi:hypothetical protein
VDDAWVAKIKLDANISLEHLAQLVSLCCLLHEVHLDDTTDDKISWNLTEDGQYSENLAYKLQLLGSTTSHMSKWVSNAFPLPSPKFKSCLLQLKILIYTAGRLEKRDWPNYGQSTTPITPGKSIF